jgi:hypothetical protein
MGMPITSASVATRLGLSRLRCPAITHPDYEEYQSSESARRRVDNPESIQTSDVDERDSDKSLKDINSGT